MREDREGRREARNRQKKLSSTIALVALFKRVWVGEKLEISHPLVPFLAPSARGPQYPPVCMEYSRAVLQRPTMVSTDSPSSLTSKSISCFTSDGLLKSTTWGIQVQWPLPGKGPWSAPTDYSVQLIQECNGRTQCLYP